MSEAFILSSCSPGDTKESQAATGAPSASAPSRTEVFGSLTDFFDLPANTPLGPQWHDQIGWGTLFLGDIFWVDDDKSDINGRVMMLLDGTTPWQTFKCLALRLVPKELPIPSGSRRVRVDNDARGESGHFDFNTLSMNVEPRIFELDRGQTVRLRSTMVIDIETVYKVSPGDHVSKIGSATPRSFRRLGEPVQVPTSASVPNRRPSASAAKPATGTAAQEQE